MVLKWQETAEPLSWKHFRATRHQRKKPLVIAHRGTRHELPENTLASFENALIQGADILETDLRLSQDGTIVLIHDATLDRTTDGSGMVAARTIGEIKRLRTKAPNGAYMEERVPTLVDLLVMTQARVPLLLELKDELFAEPQYAQQLVDTLASYDMLDRCAVISFKPELVQSILRACPHLPAGMITLTRLLPDTKASLVGPLWPLLYLNPLYVAWAHSRDTLVAPLDTTPEKRIGYYLWLGVDAVLTDRPAQTIEAMGGKG